MTAARAAERERDGESRADDAHIGDVHTERENTHMVVRCTPRFWSRVPPPGHAFSVPLHPRTHRVVLGVCGGARTRPTHGNNPKPGRSGADDATERYRASLLRYRVWGCADGVSYSAFRYVCVRAWAPRARARVCLNCTGHEIPYVVRYALSPPGCSIMWNHSATLIPLLTPLIDICALPSHTRAYVHVRRVPGARPSSSRRMLPDANLENLGSRAEGPRGGRARAFTAARVVFDFSWQMRFRRR